MALDFVRGPQWPPREWLEMTVVQVLAMVYLADDTPRGIPIHGRGDEARRNLAAALTAASEIPSPGEEAERLYSRYLRDGVQAAGDGR